MRDDVAVLGICGRPTPGRDLDRGRRRMCAMGGVKALTSAFCLPSVGHADREGGAIFQVAEQERAFVE